MHPTVQSPQPLRPLKRSLESIVSASDLHPSAKHRRLSSSACPFPSPDPSDNKNICPHPSSRYSNDPLPPINKRKRSFEDLISGDVPAKRQRLPQLPPSPISSVYQWLLHVPRPESCPLYLPSTKTSRPRVEPIKRSGSAPGRFGMSQSLQQSQASTTSTQNTRPSTSGPSYRSLIDGNQITLDLSGREIESEIQELLDKHILKKRESDQLTDAEVFEVVDTAVELMDCAEGKVSDIVATKAFPLKRPNIAEGCNIQWTMNALPLNPKYPFQLSAPKPDRHYGYPIAHKSKWTEEEKATVDHRTVQPYSKPTRENAFPFLMLEMKSEATGGVLYSAENQAVGSGVHSVNSLRWLLKEAFPENVPKSTDTVAFTGALSPRAAVLYIVWFSERKNRHIMSKFSDISFLNGPQRPDIRQCRDIMNNILDYGLDVRQKAIRNALGQLYPFPSHWKKSRSVNSTTDATSNSFAADDRPNKAQKS